MKHSGRKDESISTDVESLLIASPVHYHCESWGFANFCPDMICSDMAGTLLPIKCYLTKHYLATWSAK